MSLQIGFDGQERSEAGARAHVACGSGMFLRQRLGGWPEPEVLPSVELVVMVQHQMARRLEVRPSHQENEDQASIRVRPYVHGRLLLRLDVVEIWQATEIGPQMLEAEKALERRSAQVLHLRLAAEHV